MKKLTILLSLLIASCVKPPQDGTVMLVEKVKIVEAGKPDINIDKLVNFEPDENHRLMAMLMLKGDHDVTWSQVVKAAVPEKKDKFDEITKMIDRSLARCSVSDKSSSKGITVVRCLGHMGAGCVILTHNKTKEKATYFGARGSF